MKTQKIKTRFEIRVWFLVSNLKNFDIFTMAPGYTDTPGYTDNGANWNLIPRNKNKKRDTNFQFESRLL